MKKHPLRKQICLLLLLLFATPGYGQVIENMFRCSLRDKTGNLWFGTGVGVYRYDAITGKFTHFTKQDGLNDNSIESIFEDRSGNLWFSTPFGVCRYDGKTFTDITTKTGICNFDVNCILEDKNGNFWFGMNGYGVCHYNPISGVIKNYTKEN